MTVKHAINDNKWNAKPSKILSFGAATVIVFVRETRELLTELIFNKKTTAF
jgi:hypothetical protein